MCYKQPSCLIRLHLSKHIPSFESLDIITGKSLQPGIQIVGSVKIIKDCGIPAEKPKKSPQKSCRVLKPPLPPTPLPN